MKIINGFLFANQIFNDTPKKFPCVINLDHVEFISVKYNEKTGQNFIQVNLTDSSLMIDAEEDYESFFIDFARFQTIVEDSWQE